MTGASTRKRSPNTSASTGGNGTTRSCGLGGVFRERQRLAVGNSEKERDRLNVRDYLRQLGSYRSLKLLSTLRKWGRGRTIRTWRISPDAELGDGVRLDENVVVQKQCSVGNWSYMRSGSRLWHGSSIGAYCSIGENVLVGTPEHPKHYLSTSPTLYQCARAKPENPWPADDVLEPAHVENDVWLGNNVIVRGGVRVGTGAIVGAGAVVTRDVEPYSIVAGVPAKVIGHRFDKPLAQALLESRWWEAPREQLLASEYLFNPQLLIDRKAE